MRRYGSEEETLELKQAHVELRRQSASIQGTTTPVSVVSMAAGGKRKKRRRSTASQAPSHGSGGALGFGMEIDGHRGCRASRNDPEDDDKEVGERRRMALVISVFAAGLFLTAVLLIAITLRMTPAIDEASGLVVPNRHNGGSPRRSITPSAEGDAWLLALRAQQHLLSGRRQSYRHETLSAVAAERKRKVVVAVFAAFATMLVALAVLMITVTLRISPEIDRIGESLICNE